MFESRQAHQRNPLLRSGVLLCDWEYANCLAYVVILYEMPRRSLGSPGGNLRTFLAHLRHRTPEPCASTSEHGEAVASPNRVTTR